MTDTQASNLAAAILQTRPAPPKPSARARADRQAGDKDPAGASARRAEPGREAQADRSADPARRDEDRPAEESFEQAMRRAENPKAQAADEPAPGQESTGTSTPAEQSPDQAEDQPADSTAAAVQVAEILGLADVVKPKQTADGLILTQAKPDPDAPTGAVQNPIPTQAAPNAQQTLEAGQIASAAEATAATEQGEQASNPQVQGQTDIGAATAQTGKIAPAPEAPAGEHRPGQAVSTQTTAGQSQVVANVDRADLDGKANEQTPAGAEGQTTGSQTASIPTSAGQGPHAQTSDTGQNPDQSPPRQQSQAEPADLLGADHDARPGMLESSVQATGPGESTVAASQTILAGATDPSAQPGRNFAAALQETDPTAEIDVQSLQPGHVDEGTTTAGGAAGSAPAAGTQAASLQAQGEIERPVAAQLSNYLRARNARAGDELVLRLTPPELGSVRMTLRNQDGELRLLLEAANPRTLTQMQREAPALMQRLQDSGIEVRRMEFAQSDSQPEQDASDASGQQSQARQEMFGQGQDTGRRRNGTGSGRGRRDAGYVTETPSPADRPGRPGQAGGQIGDGTLNLWM